MNYDEYKLVTTQVTGMDKHLKDVQLQLQAIHKMTQDDDEFAENDQREVDKDELMLRSLIALSALDSYLEGE